MTFTRNVYSTFYSFFAPIIISVAKYFASCRFPRDDEQLEGGGNVFETQIQGQERVVGARWTGQRSDGSERPHGGPVRKELPQRDRHRTVIQGEETGRLFFKSIFFLKKTFKIKQKLYVIV